MASSPIPSSISSEHRLGFHHKDITIIVRSGVKVAFKEGQVGGGREALRDGIGAAEDDGLEGTAAGGDTAAAIVVVIFVQVIDRGAEGAGLVADAAVPGALIVRRGAGKIVAVAIVDVAAADLELLVAKAQAEAPGVHIFAAAGGGGIGVVVGGAGV